MHFRLSLDEFVVHQLMMLQYRHLRDEVEQVEPWPSLFLLSQQPVPYLAELATKLASPSANWRALGKVDDAIRVSEWRLVVTTQS